MNDGVETRYLYNAVFVYEPDNKYVQRHKTHIRSVWNDPDHFKQVFYYGLNQHPMGDCDWHVLGHYDNYESLALKTYGLMKHALESDFPWQRLLKTDVNTELFNVNWEAVFEHDFCGYVMPPGPGGESTLSGNHHFWRVSQPIMAQPYNGPKPLYWVGGPAYTVSRRLAQMVVDRGPWAARGHAAEDWMVSMIAQDNNIRPQPGVGYFSEGKGFTN